MSKRNRKYAQLNNAHSPTFWVVMVFLALFFMIAPFYKGLFNAYLSAFEESIYTAIIFTALVGMVMQVFLYRQMTFTTHKDLLAVIVWLLPLTYFLSSFQAASTHLAYNEIYIRMTWVAFFLIGAYYAKSALGNKLVQYIIVGSGYMLVIYGLMNWFGNATYQDALLQGNRLSNVFQYPNAYAAYLIAILISSIILINTEKRPFVQFGHAFMLVPILVSFLLTLSRGALLVLPIVVLVYLIFIPWRNQVTTLINLGLAAFISYFMFGPMTSIRTELDEGFSATISLRGWLFLILLSALTAVVIVGIHYWTNKRFSFSRTNLYRWTNIIIPVMFVILAIAGYFLVTNNSYVVERLPDEIRARVEGLNAETSSVSSRRAFYTDSFKIFKDNPVLGAGGGAWSALYHSYKSYPYTSTQAHNFLMQYLTESGILGTLALFVVVIYSIWLFVWDFIRHSKQQEDWDPTRLLYPMVAISILSHSMIDFDMSYLYLSALVFLSLGGSIARNEIQTFSLIERFIKTQKFAWKKIYIGAAAGLFVFLFAVTMISQQAAANFKSALEKTNRTGVYEEIIVPLNRAIELRPKHPEYTLFKVDILNQLYTQTNNQDHLSQIHNLINQIKKHEAVNPNVLNREIQLLMMEGHYNEALDLAESGIENFPWDIQYYELAVNLNYLLGDNFNNSGDDQLKETHWNQALHWVEVIKEKRKIVEQLPPVEKYNARMFNVNARIALDATKIYFNKREYGEAAAVLAMNLSNRLEDPTNREVVRWYLAALRLNNQDDRLWYNKLVEVDANEDKAISQLVSHYN